MESMEEGGQRAHAALPVVAEEEPGAASSPNVGPGPANGHSAQTERPSAATDHQDQHLEGGPSPVTAAMPLSGAPARPGVVTVLLHNPLAIGVADGLTRVGEQVQGANRAFHAKPGLTTAYFFGGVAFLLTLISMLPVAWYSSFIQLGGVGGFSASGTVTLLSASVCFTAAAGRTQFNPSALCTTVDLRNSALAIDYMRVAGGVAFGFELVALLVLWAASYFTKKRRLGELGDIHPRLPALRSWVLPVVLYGVAVLFLTIAWAAYYGIVAANYNAAEFQQALFVIPGNVVVSSFSAGPALVVVAWALGVVAAALAAAFRDEKDRTAEGAERVAAYTAAFSNVHAGEEPRQSPAVAAESTKPQSSDGAAPSSAVHTASSSSHWRAGTTTTTTAKLHIQRMSASPADAAAPPTPSSPRDAPPV